MSNRKRNVAFQKPEVPKFLKRIREQIGYREEVDIDSKRQNEDNYHSDSDEDEERGEYSGEGLDARSEEKPQVVVLKEGDLTAEEAERIAKEERDKPADLSQRVIFKSKRKNVKISTDQPAAEKTTKNNKKDTGKSEKRISLNKLSFNDNDDEEDEN